jgi:glutathione synthase/RimK-type ligase-like ATP-grasp enzyme
MDSARKPLILVAGGDQDPNLHQLVDTLTRRSSPFLFLQIGKHHPWIQWELDSDQLVVDGREICPSAVFVRYDVFSQLADPRPATSHRALAWNTAVMAWVAAHDEVRYLNRASLHTGTNKPHVLCLAKEFGLPIPSTIITNHLGILKDFEPKRSKVVKPINGGGYCQKLDEILEKTPTQLSDVAAAPAIIQRELVQPEYRLYRVADKFFGFAIITDELDYRVTQQCRVEPWSDASDHLLEGLRRLMDRLGLEFGAADFKTCPETGQLLFLEVNSGPMFAAFDRAAKGAITHAIADFLER